MTTDRPYLSVDASLPLVGRSREQAMLRDALAAALGGRGSLVLIGGEAGIGKTALAEALCQEAAGRGALVLVGRCYDLAETPPYGPWRELLARAPVGESLPILPAAVLPPERDGAALSGQDAIVRRILAYIAALGATRPLVLLLEDLHWADPASLDLLRFLARNLADVSVLLLATYRADEIAVAHPLASLLPALVREARAVRLELRPLDATAIDALIALRYALGVAERERLVGYLIRRTEGNPLFLGELLRTLETSSVLRPGTRSSGIDGRDGWMLGDLAKVPVPALLRQVIAGRLARLGDEDRRLLAVAAVLGQELPFDLWAMVGEVEEAALLATAERAIAVRLLETTDTGVRFAHALIREVLYEGVLAPRRRVWHGRAGEALLATSHPDPDSVAYHLRQAGDPRAAEWLMRAGERAQRAYAWFTAADRYEAALTLLEAQGNDSNRRIELLITLAQLRRYRDPGGSADLLEEAARLADTLGDAAQAASARFEAGHTRCIGWADPDGLAAMAMAMPILDTLTPAERARLPALRILGVSPAERYHRGALMGWLQDMGRYAETWTLAAPFLAGEPGVPSRGLKGIGGVHAMYGRPEQSRQAFVASAAMYRASGQYIQLAGAIKNVLTYVVLPYQADRVAERRQLAAEAEAAMARASGASASLPPRIVAIELLVLEGNWPEVRALAEVGRSGTYIGGRAESVTALARVARAQGDHALAWASIRDILPAGAATGPDGVYFYPSLTILPTAASLALDKGDLAEASAWLAAHNRWIAWSGAVLGCAEGALGWAAYHRAAGDPSQARAHAEAALAYATAPRQPLALLAAHRMLGELATAIGQHAEAAPHLAAALALAESCAAPYERALSLLALAELRAAMGDQHDAGAALAAARVLLASLDARPALVRADALAATLAPPVAPATTYPVGLTAREVEVLRLIAAGCANHEIAARLSISSNTVMRHVTHILTKTGTDNRAAAAVFALRHGLDMPGDGR